MVADHWDVGRGDVPERFSPFHPPLMGFVYGCFVVGLCVPGGRGGRGGIHSLWVFFFGDSDVVGVHSLSQW